MRVISIAYAFDIPGLQIYLFRRHHGDLIKNHVEGTGGYLELLKDWIVNKQVKVNHSKATIEFYNGSKIFLCSMQHESDKMKFLGVEIHLALFDEVTTFLASQYEFIRSRCRVSETLNIPDKYKGQFPKIISGSNPGSISHNYFKSNFVDMCPPGEIVQMSPDQGGMKRQYIPFGLEHNKFINYDDYAGKLQGLGTPELVRAMLEGDWSIVQGGAFDDLWDRNIHVINHVDLLKSEIDISLSYDHGSSKPWAASIVAKVRGVVLDIHGNHLNITRGSYIVVDELYGWTGKPDVGDRKTIKEISELINNKVKQIPNCKIDVADSAIWADNAGRGSSIAEEFRRYGINFSKCEKYPGSRRVRFQKFREYLKNSIDGEGVGVYFTKNCLQHIRTIPTLPMSSSGDDIDTTAEDHCFSGDTLIKTNKGIQRFDEIDSTGFVDTIDGYKPYTNGGLIRKNSKMIRLTLADGSILDCTPDHKFLTFDGFKEAHELEYVLKSEGGEEWTQSLLVEQNKNLMELDIISKDIILADKDMDVCIEMFGYTIMEKYQKECKFITKTVIDIITRLTTLKYSHQNNISESILKTLIELNRQERLLLKMLNSLRFGMGVKKVENGIEDIIKTLLKKLTSKTLKNNASNVVNHSSAQEHVCHGLNSAHQHVTLNTEEIVELITKIGFANTVQNRFQSIDFKKISSVQEVVSLEVINQSNSYCLTTEAGHFKLNDGFVVSNCFDACVYGCIKKDRSMKRSTFYF